MELKINREMIPVTETILDDVQEQSVELDYVLPDYDPDIFRIIGCEMHPTIVSYTTASDRITYELRVDIRILYCGAGSTLLQCVSQQMMFSRSAVKNITLSEEVELGAAKPPIRSIVRNNVRLVHQETSILAGKLIVKGDAEVQLLYTWQKDDGSGGMESMQFTLPYSQIVDMEQIDESYRSSAEAQVIRCDLKPSAEVLQCEIELRLCCTAIQTASVQLVTDAFSTCYPCQQTPVSVQIDMAPERVYSSMACSAVIRPGDRIPECIYDLQCQVRNINMQLLSDTNRIRVSGMLCCSLLAADAEGMPVLLEKEEAFEAYADPGTSVADAVLRAQVEPADCTYHLASDGTISVQANLLLHGALCPSARHVCLSDLEVDGENKLVRDGDYALKLYYGVEHEDIWDIAKRCHTSVDAIMEENELAEEQLANAGMLFIPIVH